VSGTSNKSSSRWVWLAAAAALLLSWQPLVSRSWAKSGPLSKDERMRWWREARFGMFIHWGLYAVPAGEYKGKRIPGIGEWIMQRARIPVAEYEKFAARFNPAKFDADQWVRIAKNAGMKYIVITSKHHDGFCLWNSKVTDYDVMDATPFKRDILKELSEACKRHGIRLCFYYSIMDWHHPDAQAPFYPNYNDTSKSNPNFRRYVEHYMKPQLKELITNYGPLGVLWFDGEWIKDWTKELGKELYDYVLSLQPDIIVNNRVGKGRQGMQGMSKSEEYAGDFGTPEQQIPPTGLPGADWETCMTMNDTWGYKYYDNNWKSVEDLLHKLADIASKGGNFLLNVGPTREGLIPQPSVERLEAMGRWMKVNGESIYGTTASVFPQLPWGRSTTKPGKLYLHVFDWPKDGRLVVPGLLSEVKRAYLLVDPQRKALSVTRQWEDVVVAVPKQAPDPINSVVVLEIEGKPEVVSRIRQGANGWIVLKAVDATVVGRTARYESGGGKDNIGFWTDINDYVKWEFSLRQPGRFQVEIEYACNNDTAGSEYVVSVAGQQLHGKVRQTGGWTQFVKERLGTVRLGPVGRFVLSVRPISKPGYAVMNLRAIRLLPVRQ